jgi:hypothetical protein
VASSHADGVASSGSGRALTLGRALFEGPGAIRGLFMTDAPERRNFYGRIRGKTLRASQKDYLAEDLGPLTLRASRERKPGAPPLDLGSSGAAALAGGRLWRRASIWSIWPRGTRT